MRRFCGDAQSLAIAWLVGPRFDREVRSHGEKITFGEMRGTGVRGILICCCDYKCSHHVAVLADQWPDEVRLSELEPKSDLISVRIRPQELNK